MPAILYENKKKSPEVEGVNLSWIRFRRLGKLPMMDAQMVEGYYNKDEQGVAITNDLGINEWVQYGGGSWVIQEAINSSLFAQAGIQSCLEPQADLNGATFAQAQAQAWADFQQDPTPANWGKILYLFDDTMNTITQKMWTILQDQDKLANLPSMVG